MLNAAALQAQSLKAADVAAAFADLRDGPKSSSSGTATSVSTPAGGAGSGNGQMMQVVVEEEEEGGGEAGGVFVIGDDGSEASEVCFAG